MKNESKGKTNIMVAAIESMIVEEMIKKNEKRKRISIIHINH